MQLVFNICMDFELYKVIQKSDQKELILAEDTEVIAVHFGRYLLAQTAPDFFPIPKEY